MIAWLSVENLDDIRGGGNAGTRRADLLRGGDAALVADMIAAALAVGEDMMN